MVNHYTAWFKLIKNVQNVGDDRQLETVQYCYVKWTFVWKAQGYWMEDKPARTYLVKDNCAL